MLARQLWCVGISEIYLDGSFVDDKDHPNDIDGYFVCRLDELASGELEARLNELDPNRSWTWAPESRWPYRAYGKLQLPMWHLYRVELYPHVGQFSGIVDEYGYELEFPSAFRRARDGRRRGVVRVIPEE